MTWKQDPHSNDPFYDFTNYLFYESDAIILFNSMCDKYHPSKHKVIRIISMKLIKISMVPIFEEAHITQEVWIFVDVISY